MYNYNSGSKKELSWAASLPILPVSAYACLAVPAACLAISYNQLIIKSLIINILGLLGKNRQDYSVFLRYPHLKCYFK